MHRWNYPIQGERWQRNSSSSTDSDLDLTFSSPCILQLYKFVLNEVEKPTIRATAVKVEAVVFLSPALDVRQLYDRNRNRGRTDCRVRRPLGKDKTTAKPQQAPRQADFMCRFVPGEQLSSQLRPVDHPTRAHCPGPLEARHSPVFIRFSSSTAIVG